MKYKITVQEVTPPKEGEKYNTSETIYEQTVETLELAKLVLVVNNLAKEEKSEYLTQ